MGHLDLPPPPDRLILLVRTPTGVEGMLVRGLLQSEGIPVFTKGEADGPYRTGGIDVWVPEGLEVQARHILEQARSDGDRDASLDEAEAEAD